MVSLKSLRFRFIPNPDQPEQKRLHILDVNEIDTFLTDSEVAGVNKIKGSLKFNDFFYSSLLFPD